MRRPDIIDRIRSEGRRDLVVIGGGATGLGTALDAVSRGYRTLLVEAHDFAKGTSGRSTKLVHGGVRYLAQGRMGLVRQALRERDILRRNAPHLVHDRAFLIPSYSRWSTPYYGLGLRAYDVLAGKSRWAWSQTVSREAAVGMAPSIATENLRGGVVYRDGQFDDARMAIALLRTFLDRGGTALNHAPAIGMLRVNGKISGVLIRDAETGEELAIEARAVVNATGVFADSVRHLDEPSSRPMIAPSQGIHLVLDASFLPGETAVMIPRTADGRVLFAIPWLGKVVLGTTDTPVASIVIEPRALPREIDFLLDHAGRYFRLRPDPSHIKSVYAGLRPLIGRAGEATSSLSREHIVLVSKSGLISVTGGKWTTYRVMARDAVDRAAEVAGLPPRECVTESLPLHAGHQEEVAALVRADPSLGDAIHAALPYSRADVLLAARRELARTVEDVLARRTRSLLLNAEAANASAEAVAAILAEELGRDDAWRRDQVAEFRRLASGYLPK